MRCLWAILQNLVITRESIFEMDFRKLYRIVTQQFQLSAYDTSV
jgi:hypothetical protein